MITWFEGWFLTFPSLVNTPDVLPGHLTCGQSFLTELHKMQINTQFRITIRGYSPLFADQFLQTLWFGSKVFQSYLSSEALSGLLWGLSCLLLSAENIFHPWTSLQLGREVAALMTLCRIKSGPILPSLSWHPRFMQDWPSLPLLHLTSSIGRLCIAAGGVSVTHTDSSRWTVHAILPAQERQSLIIDVCVSCLWSV